MFNNKRLDKIEKRITRMEEEQRSFLNSASVIMAKLQSDSKSHYMWELKQEEIELQEDGHKLRKIRKILQ